MQENYTYFSGTTCFLAALVQHRLLLLDTHCGLHNEIGKYVSIPFFRRYYQLRREGRLYPFIVVCQLRLAWGEAGDSNTDILGREWDIFHYFLLLFIHNRVLRFIWPAVT